jgi:tetratricopeptide (TPR) repeat protein
MTRKRRRSGVARGAGRETARRETSDVAAAKTGRAFSGRHIQVLIIVLALAATYAASLGNDFVFDDRYVILNNEVVTDPSRTAGAFDVQFYQGLNYYRPISLLTFALEHRLWGPNPLGFHITSLVLLIGAGVALFFTLTRLLGTDKKWVACLLALCFCLHPAVSSVGMALGARGDLLCILFLLCAFLCYLRGSVIGYAGAAVLFALALLSKETAVTFPVVLLVMELLRIGPYVRGSKRELKRTQNKGDGNRAVALRLLPFWAILAAYLALRKAVLPGVAYGFELDGVLTIKSYLYMLQTSLLPTVGLAYEPTFEDWFSPLKIGIFAALAAVIVALFAITDRSRRRTVAFWLAWAAVTFLPTANVVFQETIYDERYAVLPALGIVVGIGLLVYYAGRRPRAHMRGKAVFCVLLLACFAAITAGRGRTWSDDSTFLSQWMKTSRENPRPRHHLGIVFWKKGRTDVAAGLFADAVRLDPDYVPSLNMLGLSAYVEGDNETAIRHCSKAVELDPNYEAAQYNLATAYLAKGDYENAFEHFSAAAELDPEWLEALYGVAKTSQELEKWEHAVVYFRNVLKIDPTVAEAYFGLSEIYEAHGRTSQAVGLLRQGLAHAPDDTAAVRRLRRLTAGGKPRGPETAPEGP